MTLLDRVRSSQMGYRGFNASNEVYAWSDECIRKWNVHPQ